MELFFFSFDRGFLCFLRRLDRCGVGGFGSYWVSNYCCSGFGSQVLSGAGMLGLRFEVLVLTGFIFSESFVSSFSV